MKTPLTGFVGTASVAKGLSLYIDNMIGNPLSSIFRELFPINISFLSPYPDFLAFVVVMLLTGNYSCFGRIKTRKIILDENDEIVQLIFLSQRFI